ncbi:MAG: hypothetical protein LBH18_02975 [Spirochaetaceae bacterium]|jgi:hypothetical protein|nr:hypothetical protein [Spirochaetaceae bacterium]
MLTRRGFYFAVSLIFLYVGSAGTDIFASDMAYQTPTVLYAGDRGTLVYPLDIFIPLPEGSLVFPDGLPRTDDIIIHKIDIDRRGRRVFIEFQAFRTGTVPLPPIPFGEVELKGLQVNVSSILDSVNSMTLSPAAGTMSAPGTFWMITAFSALLALGLVAAALLCMKGGVIFTGTRSALRARILFCLFNFRLRRLEKNLENGRLSEKDALAVLSNEIRGFLSRLWMRPCYALSAEEFRYIDVPAGGSIDTVKLAGFFKECDEIRFAATAVPRETVDDICVKAKDIASDTLKKLVKKN